MLAAGRNGVEMICPQCRNSACYRSHRAGLRDFLFTLLGCRPWRCEACEFRFYGRRAPLRFIRFAHCPKCGNFDLERISRERVEKGTMVGVKRVLKFRALRCDRCRERFFSVRPLRRILPSNVFVAEAEIPSEQIES